MEHDILFSSIWICGIYLAYHVGYIKGYEKSLDDVGEYDSDHWYESGFNDGMSYAMTEETKDSDV
jgi:hypothetical protein